jgi:hypothetical protein
VTKRLIVGITLLGCLALCIDLQAQAGGDVEQQIKHLQQEATDAQMKSDVSWAEQHLAEGFLAGHSWGEWQTKAEFIKDLQNKTKKWKVATSATCMWPRSARIRPLPITSSRMMQRSTAPIERDRSSAAILG